MCVIISISNALDICKVHALKEDTILLWTIFVVLLILWLLGLVSGYVVGGFIHLLLVLALVVLLIQIIGGRRPII